MRALGRFTNTEGPSYPRETTPRPAGRRRLPADLPARIAVAVPAAAVLVLLVHLGGMAFAAPLAVLGALGHAELARMRGLAAAAAIPGALAVAAVVLG